MKAKGIFKFLSVFIVLTAIINVCAYAGAVSTEVITFEDFESYNGTVGGNWNTVGNSTSTEVVETEKGKSAKVVAGTKYTELRQDFTTISTDTATSVLMGFSLKFGDLGTLRQLYTKGGTTEFPIMNFEDNGHISIGGVSCSEFTFSADVWYDFVVEYNFNTGYTRCKVFDGENDYVVTGTNTKKVTGIFRFDLLGCAPASGESVTYVDNVWVSALSYDVTAKESLTEDYEDFTSTSRSNTVPDSTLYAVASYTSGTDGIYAGAPEGSPYGKSICIECDDGNVALYRYLPTVQKVPVSFNFDLYYSEIYLTVMVRGTNENGNSITDRTVAVITGDGNIGASATSTPIHQLSKNNWYNIDISFSPEKGCVITVTDSAGNKYSGAGGSYGGITEFSRIDFWANKMTNNVRFYMDNLTIKSANNAIETGFTPVLRLIDTDVEEICVNFSSTVNAASLANAIVTVNGIAVPSASLTANGNKLHIPIGELEYNKVYVVEYSGVTVGDRTGMCGMDVYYTLAESAYELGDISFSAESVTIGDILASVSGRIHPASTKTAKLAAALYSIDENDMVILEAIDVVYVNASAQVDDYNAKVSVPGDSKEYFVKAFLWDKDMMPLYESASLGIE